MCNPVSTAHPELLLAKGEYAGYQWEVTSNNMGYRCGYVRVPPGHPWHGKDYEEVNAHVHGGLTFARPDTDCGKGGEDNAWWLGFDCAHCGDAPDPELPGYSVGSYVADDPEYWRDRDVIRTTEYVETETECKSLAEQASDAASTAGPVLP